MKIINLMMINSIGYNRLFLFSTVRYKTKVKTRNPDYIYDTKLGYGYPYNYFKRQLRLTRKYTYPNVIFLKEGIDTIPFCFFISLNLPNRLDLHLKSVNRKLFYFQYFHYLSVLPLFFYTNMCRC